MAHTHGHVASILPFLQTLHGSLLDLGDLDPPRRLSPPVVHHTRTQTDYISKLPIFKKRLFDVRVLT